VLGDLHLGVTRTRRRIIVDGVLEEVARMRPGYFFRRSIPPNIRYGVNIERGHALLVPIVRNTLLLPAAQFLPAVQFFRQERSSVPHQGVATRRTGPDGIDAELRCLGRGLTCAACALVEPDRRP
jgi:hypothetical protein